MNLEKKLQDLKEMHEKGLITSAIYEEQQKAMLVAQFANVSPKAETSLVPPVSPGETKSGFLDPQKNLSLLSKIFVGIFIVLGGIWLFFNLSGKEGKSAVSQFVADSGIGKQVIPWPDRAEAVANSLVQPNQQNIANAIQGIAHPTGKNPSLVSYRISKLNNSVIVEFQVSWQGGFVGNGYTTVVIWEISESNHVQARITDDTATVAVDANHARQLNDYFYSKVYPAFVEGMGR